MTSDERWLKSIGVTMENQPEDPHSLCHERWLQERAEKDAAVATAARSTKSARDWERFANHQEEYGKDCSRLALLFFCLLVVAVVAIVVMYATGSWQ